MFVMMFQLMGQQADLVNNLGLIGEHVIQYCMGLEPVTLSNLSVAWLSSNGVRSEHVTRHACRRSSMG
jgi:hypothetical protein